MKDIDFDELDRAVSSVLETPGEEATTSDATPVEVSTTNEAPKEEVSPSEPETAAEVEEPTPVEPSKRPLAVKRRGQFMDVVHPSSDMTGKPAAPSLSAPSKINVMPISESVVPEQIGDTSVETSDATTDEIATTDEATVVPPVVDAGAVEQSSDSTTWPDPLDVMEAKEGTSDVTEPTEQPGSSEETPLDAVPSTEPETVEDEPAPTTPFLTDTKVDKRPLDAFSSEEVAETTEPEGVETPEDNPVIPELQPDVVAVESASSENLSEKHVDETPTEEKHDEPESGFNSSIPQQYAAVEDSSSEDHSIFDTREYHQPLAPNKPKKGGLPGWLTAVLVILLLAALGAAGGYFWFYYGL